MPKKLVMVDTLSQFIVRYVVEVDDDAENALGVVAYRIDDPEFKEFSQRHLGYTILSHREIDANKYIELFDAENDYLASWTDEQKKSFINVIEYNEQEETDDGA